MSLHLNAPTNWDNALLDEISRMNASPKCRTRVEQIYGAVLTNIGGGRIKVPRIAEQQVREHIALAHSKNLSFNYVLNAPSAGGMEFVRNARPDLVRTIKWVEDVGADTVTVANPFLGELVKYHAPRLHLKISVMTEMRSVQNVKLIERMWPPANSITLGRAVNREFRILRQIIQNTELEVELLANSLCLLDCPLQHYHADLVGWLSKATDSHPDDGRQGTPTDYCILKCINVRLNDPVEVVRSAWIRPEDTTEYENIGVSAIKLAGREWSTDRIVRMIDAYSSRNYDGNLWELIASDMPIYLDNKSLDGFLKHFIDKDFECNEACGRCRYCDTVAAKHVHLLPEAAPQLERIQRKLADYPLMGEGTIPAS
jgi:collagenase-like PrtC family protease